MNGFRHFLPVAASETLFLAIFEEKPQATACFRRFSLVACKRNAVFGVFCISLTSDERFSGFLIFPRGGKCSLRRFLVFSSVGKSTFSIFYASQCWDDLFLSFFMLPKFGKADFQCFPCFPMLGNAIFSVFYLSEGSEMRFSAFFIFPRGWKCDFRHFSSFRGVGNAIFGVFLSFRGVRNAIFGIFRLSNPLEAERCLNRIHVISELPPMFFLVRMLWKSLCELLSEKMIEAYAVMNHPVDLSPIG